MQEQKMVVHRSTTGPGSALVRHVGTWAIVLAASLLSVSAATDIYVETVIDPSGQLRITTKRRKEIVPKKEADQVSFERAAISPDGRAVGWLALFPNSIAPEPVPLKLVILANGAQRSFTGSGLPISGWCFWAGGRQVAFKQGTIRGGMGAHYELHDIVTGELSDKYDPDANPDSVTKPPRWVVVMDSRY